MHRPPSDKFQTLQKGRFRARAATGAVDVAAALRAECFGVGDGQDRDAIDDRALHVLIEETHSGALVGCYRLLILDGASVGQSYAAQFYDLKALAAYPGVLCELGRFCIHPAWQDPDILRVAWAAMTAFVDASCVGLLFGCSSFQGTDAAVYRDAFGVLHRLHQAPAPWQIGVRAPEVVRLQGFAQGGDRRAANRQLPPLLKTYLLMGGWVSDHAVIDRHMNTLHVFTGLEIGAIPEARKRALRALV